MSNWDEHQRKMQGRMGLMRSMLSVSPYLTALCVGWATFQATHNIVLTIMAALILAAMGRVPIVPVIVLAIGQLVLIRWVTWPVYVLGGWGVLMMVYGYFIRKANLDFLDNYVNDGRFEHRPIDSDAEVVLEQQFEPEQPSEPDLWEDENDSPQEGESSVDARQELRISYTPSVPLKEKPERNWEKILLYVVLSFVALLVVAVFMLMNLNQGNQQRQPYPSSYAPAQTAEYQQPASSPSIQTAQENKASSEQAATVPADRQDEPLYEEAFAANLRKQDAQKIFAYLQNHKYLEATWTAASGETRGAMAGTREEISDGFAVLTKIETLTEDGRPGDSYDVWMVDENSDGVLDAIMYINSRNPEEKHAYHHPTDEASMLNWKLSLRELAKAAR